MRAEFLRGGIIVGMDDLHRQSTAANNLPSQEFQSFSDGLRHLFTVPKSEIDRREVEWRESHPKRTVKKKPKADTSAVAK